RDRTIFYPETQTGWVTGNVSHTFVVALHDVTFSDVRVDAVTSPISDLCGYDANGTVSVDLYNYGYKAQSGFTVKYQLDGGAWVSEIFTDTIEPATSYSYTFTTAADLSVVGDHTVTADTSISPPESSKTVYSHKAKTYSSIPYGVNFEGGSNDWVVTSSGNPLVALGTPAKSTIIGAKSGVNALVTGGLAATTANYNNNAAIVTGPCFDLSAAVEPEFAFHIWWESTPNQDGAVVQVSIDDGNTWSVLGSPQTGENWYNSQSISQTPAGQSMGWSGSGPSGSGAWLLARHMLDEYAGESSVRFRIVYEDYRNTANDGLAIDNIMVTERQSAPPVPLSLLDQSFATGGVYVYAAGSYYPSQGRNVDVSPDGKIYVGGTDRTASGAYSNAAIWAFNDDGSPDVSFNSTGFKAEGGAYPHGHDLFIDSLGKIVMSGYRESGGRDAPTIWRYAANGALDSGFGSGGVAATSFAGLEIESDRSVQDLINGGYLLVGRQYGNYMTLSKLTLAGALDTSFSGDGKLDFQTIPTNMGHDIAVDSLGRIVVVGEGNPGAGDRDAIVWRYLANGTLDTAFNGTGYIELDGAAGTPGNHDAAIAVTIDASDDILVAGNSRNAAGDLDFVLWKLSGADGTLDTTFNGTGVIAYNGSAGGSGDDSPADMLIDGGGNIWIVGESTNATPNKDMCIWKLLPTGVPDSTFNKTGIFCHDGAAGGTYESGQGMAIDSAGRIVITGEASDGAKNRMTVWRLGGTATIAGTVTIQGSGLPLAGAVVSAPGYGSDTTDAAGNYEIRFIAEGAAYTVEAASQNYTFLPASFSGTASGIVTHNFTAVPSVATYSITGIVTDQGSPLAGVTIDGGSLGSVVTAGDGTYSFVAIPVGTSYTLSPSFNSALFFPLLTNSNLTGNATHNFQVIAAHQDALYTLSGTVNFAGTGLAGVTVNGGALGTTVTDGSGNYSFIAVPANTFYSLTYSASGYTFIPATRSGVLFGNTHHITTAQTATYTVAGSVSNSGSPLSGVVVSGGALGYTVSDLSGNFQFTSVPDGVNYTVALQRQGYTFAPASVSATASGNANHAFTATTGNYLLTGTVLEGGIPLAGVVVTGGAIGNRLTNAAGQFSYTLPYGTSYNLSFAKAGTVVSPATVSGSLAASTNLALTATRNLHTVSGHITLSGAGLAGVLVSAGSLGTVITDSSGYYSFSSVPYGSNYSVTPTLSGHTFSPFQVTGTVTGNRVHDFAGLEGADIDLGQNVSGKVTLTNLEHSPLAGVTVTAGGRSAVTNSLGAYTIELVPPGEHTVSADLSGYVISRELSSVTITDQAVSDVDFTAYPHVTNPAYAMWNGFLGMINILEIMNTGDDPLTVSLTLFTIGGSGNPVSKTWTVPAMTQRDIIINDLQGFEADTYGMFKVECSHDHFDGRVSLYYPDTTGAADVQYGFAYTEALRDVSKGQTAVMYNSYHPGGHIYDSNNTVYNWLTIANLDESRTKSFTVRRYDMSGVFVTEAHVSVPPLGRRDIDGGHVNPGPNNVGTNIIIPDDSSSPYLANVVRYAEGSNFDAFDYAITLPAEAGFSRSVYLPMSVEFAAENFIEVANILNEPVNVHFSYIDSDGYVVADHVINFPALAQRHFNSAGLLLDVQSGYVKISSDKPKSILAQSVFYHRDLGTRSVQTAYASPAREIFGEKLYTTYNSFLNMKNYLRLMNIAEEESQVTYYFPDGSQRSGSLRNADSIQMPETSSLTINLGSVLREQSADSYGLVGINT
ncbi:MAG: carboxypeptidase regulatory-like domain-containing protein, partial [bacterium]|nr:carboxypeptidase regulatory-like domain-containing protein [bacterium]